MNQFFLWKTKDLWFLMAIFNHNFSSFWEQPVPSKKQQPKPYLRRRELKIYYYRKIYFSPHRRKRVSDISINPNF